MSDDPTPPTPPTPTPVDPDPSNPDKVVFGDDDPDDAVDADD